LKGQILAQQEQQKITQDITVSPSEVAAYYNAIPKDSLKYYESQFEANQIVAYPVSNEDVVNYIKDELENWKKDVEAGKANFAELARIYSDDPSAKQNGGQINMNRIDDKGKYDPDFFNAAFRLREGQISPVIKSQFGYHIIQMVSRVGNDAIVRHILKIPPVTQEEINDCVKKMDSIRNEITDKKMDFSVAFALYNQDKNGQFNAGAISGGYPQNPISPFSTDQLMDTALATVIPTLQTGEFSKPQVFSDPYSGKQGVRIIYLKSRTQPHRENLQDDYMSIQARALAAKKQKAIEDWLATHVQDFYIRLDPSFAHCVEIQQWVKNSNDRVEHFASTKVVK
jgi:peptidyl-prolyl cis-trans isomerase SurA